MKTKGLTLTLVLMTTSIVLLLVLQGIWLDNAYEKAFHDFRRQASGLFRTAVFAVRDSALFKEIESIPSDSVNGHSNFLFTTRVDSQIIEHKKGVSGIEIKRSSSPQIQVYLSSKTRPDSIKAILQPYAARFTENKINGVSRFVIRMNHDSLSTDSIRVHFEKLSRGSKFQLPFEITKALTLPSMDEGMLPPKFDVILGTEENPVEAVSLLTRSMPSEWVRVDPVTRYSAILHDFRPSLLKEILPQILFAIFLSVVTILAFIFMYRSIRAQERLMQLKNDFISNITHELKTPIATVSVALEALDGFRGKDNPQVTKEYLDIARYELDRLAQLTDKVLTTSLFDEEGIALEFHPTDIGTMIGQILSTLKPVLEKAGAQVQVTREGNDFVVQGNEFHLSHVIHNLIDNALKYSAHSPSILIHLHDQGDHVRIVVQDQGNGIPEEFQKKVFEKFFRVPTGDIHNTKGYGLGLNYVWTVVKQHGGQVDLKSKPGEGSTFTLVLPKHH